MDPSRPIIAALFVASCLLSVVSWYTTQQGMALYLSPWFAVLASLGIQSALVLTAWLLALSRTRRWLLVGVYAITACVSVAFSYVSLYTWFSAKERPATVQRKLYDSLTDAAARSEELLAAAASEQQKHVLALEEMAAAERTRGYISKAEDADAYLSEIREAVAREARTYSASYREGGGEGLRYTAFERYGKIAAQSLSKIEESRRALAQWRAQRKPATASEQQLRDFEQVYASLPWGDVERALHRGAVNKPVLPSYAGFVDQTASGQEDLLVAFEELAANPSGRPLFALLLAAFIDVVIFLLAWGSGPHLAGGDEQQWLRAGAAVDGVDRQVFLRGFLRKVEADGAGGARVEYARLSEGERQLALALTGQGLAVMTGTDGQRFVTLDDGAYQSLLQGLARPSAGLRAQSAAAAG